MIYDLKMQDIIIFMEHVHTFKNVIKNFKPLPVGV